MGTIRVAALGAGCVGSAGGHEVPLVAVLILVGLGGDLGGDVDGARHGGGDGTGAGARGTWAEHLAGGHFCLVGFSLQKGAKITKRNKHVNKI